MIIESFREESARQKGHINLLSKMRGDTLIYRPVDESDVKVRPCTSYSDECCHLIRPGLSYEHMKRAHHKTGYCPPPATGYH